MHQIIVSTLKKTRVMCLEWGLAAKAVPGTGGLLLTPMPGMALAANPRAGHGLSS